MTCREFEEIVIEVARGTAAEPEHGRACSHCAARLAAERGLTEALRAVAEEDEEFQAGPGAEARLREEFRRLRAARRAAWRRAGVAGGAIAAGLAVMTVLREPLRPKVETADAAPAVRPAFREEPGEASAETARVEPPKTMLDDAGGQRALPARRGTAPAGEGPLVTREVATQFLPLGAGLIDAGERAQVVRISVPKTALLALGLPVTMERLEERVQADVLLGEDGTARAIRFVSER